MRERGSPLFFLAVVALLLGLPAQASDLAALQADLSTPASNSIFLTTVTTPETPTATVPMPVLDAAAPAPGETTTTTTPGPAPLNRVRRTRHILWPVPGYLDVASSWGADRDGGTRLHRGNDIMAPKLTPVVAVANGTIGSIHGQRGDCCWIILNHDDGWSSWYLHLNNDVLGSDNGRGNGIRPDLVEGSRVTAGEVIGWVGDSGNAEPGAPHLHFELHMPGVGAIDPYPSLRWARNNTGQPAFATSFNGAFSDDDGLRSEYVFELLTTLGAAVTCDSWAGQACPTLAATELETASWLSAIAGVTIEPPAPEVQVSASVAMSAATVCAPELCPPPPITRGELVTMVLWSLQQRSFEQAEGSPAPQPLPRAEINPVAALSELQYLGLTDICPLLELPMDSLVSRGQVAEMIGQAFGLVPSLVCGQVS